MLIVAGHLSVVACVVAVIWLLWLDHWYVIYDSFLIPDMCCLCCMAVCACRLFLSSYLVFHLVYYTDKPLWLDGYLWLDDKVCVSYWSSVWTRFLPTIYTGTSLQYIPQLRYLDIDLEASEFAPFYPSISCIPSRSNSTSALLEPLFIIVCFACNSLLVAVSPSH